MIKVGALSFINAFPFFNPFIEKRVSFSGELLFGSPTLINSKLETGQVDVALISSATFVQNREKYVLLTNFGIGTAKAMKSVCLFSKYEISKLDGKKVAIGDASSTSALLLKVLCRYYWGVSPKFIEVSSSGQALFEKYDAVLLIGDECLLMPKQQKMHTFDLAVEWYSFTQKPFVFAVFATRVDAWIKWPDEVREFHRQLVSAYDYSTNNFSAMLTNAQTKTGLSKSFLQDYYKGLDYYLDSSHFQGLEQFAALNAKRAS